MQVAMVAMCGVPSVITPAIRSGRRTASTRANMPPRLWPIRRIGSSVSDTIISMRRSSARTAFSEQSMLARMPARRGV